MFFLQVQLFKLFVKRLMIVSIDAPFTFLPEPIDEVSPLLDEDPLALFVMLSEL
jgi:hypothetical protein